MLKSKKIPKKERSNKSATGWKTRRTETGTEIVDKRREVYISPRQKGAVDNIISGRFPSKKAALLAAGYGESVARAAKDVLEQKGTLAYIARLNKRAKDKLGMEIDDKLVDTYVNALDATKLYGRKGIEHPDHTTRLSAADKIMEVKGLKGGKSHDKSGDQYNQYNFFSVKEDERKEFDKNMKKFLEDQYSD